MKSEIQNYLKDKQKESLNLSAREFWKELYPDTDIPEEIWGELTDFYFIMNEVPKVYNEITGGQLSKCNYFSSAVINSYNEYQNIVSEELIKEELQNILFKAGISYPGNLNKEDLSNSIIQLLDKVTT